MDPNVDKSPALALPPPSGAEYLAPSEGIGGALSHAPETSATMEAAPAPQAPVAPVPMPMAVPLPPATAQSMTAQPTNPSASSTSSTKDDSSVSALDEEWINKAKAIVERTKADPYVESKELSRAKADYLRIRYNKQLKVAEDPQQ